MIGLLRPWLRRWAVEALQPRFGRDRAEALFREAWERFRGLVPVLPRTRGRGGALMVRAAALTEALYGVLLDEVREVHTARALTARVTWAVYRRMAKVPERLARGATDPVERVRRATAAFRRFPFGPPAYEMVDVPAELGTVAFDVLRCPVADYLEARGLAALCVDTWCALDDRLACEWGCRLERTGTLAGGASCCDFRWCVESVASRPKRFLAPL